MNQIEAAKIAIQAAIQKANDSFLHFVLWTKPDYSPQWFHKYLAQKLQDFERGKIKKMMVFMPPQHGKSEMTTRRFPAYLLGKDPKRKIALGTYSATLAQSFNRDIQRVIDDSVYSQIFPETLLNESNVVTDAKKGYVRNSEMFETVGHRGFVKTVGRGGSLTGTPVDIGIIDDPLKDRAEAMSHTIRDGLWSWFTDVFETRLHNDSQILIILTRWHEDDLAGRILQRDPHEWEVVTFEALKTENYNPHDPRIVGEALWENKHSRVRLEKVRDSNPFTFNSLYQQNPQPNRDALIFPNHIIGDFDNNLSYCYGMDFGFTIDPTTLVRVAVDNRNKRIYIEEIMYDLGNLRGTDDIYNAVKCRLINDSDLIVGDSHGQQGRLIYDLRVKGLNIVECAASKIIDDIIPMQDYQIVVTPDSVNVQRELKGYIWNDKKAGIAISENDHTIDPTRYAFNRLKNGDAKRRVSTVSKYKKAW
jgi:hypothetical protein